MTDTPERDPLDDLLAPPPAADAAWLRQAVLAATARPLRRRRWLRRGALVAALAACFAAGMLTTRWLMPAAPTAVVQADGPREQRNAPAPPPSEAPAPPQRETDVAASLLRAGDHFLNEEGDPAAALRCYTGALNAGSEDDTRFSPDDNWLLMAIKTAREKEARHENDDG